jgi:hypothetical protein
MRQEHLTHPEEIMKPDLLSEILLAGTGLALFVPLLLILLAALNQSV